MFQARSGSPLTPATTGNLSLTGLGNQRPFVVGDPDLDDRNVDAVVQHRGVCAEHAGSVGRRAARLPARARLLEHRPRAVARRAVRRYEQRIELRVEAFNLTNRVHLGNPNVTLGNANFGRIINTVADPRIMQFAVKYLF